MSTRQLLSCGVIAGPLFMLLYVGQAFTRPGFDITRHPASILSNGDLGWIQVLNFLASGALVVAGARGMRQALRGGPGGTWGPLLLALTGLGLVAAAFFKADPMDGFPPGTPAGAPGSISTMGLLHFVAAAAAFFSWIAASLVFARRFSRVGERRWALLSAGAGVFLLAAFLGTASGMGPIFAFVLAVAVMWAWHSATFAKLITEPADTEARVAAPA